METKAKYVKCPKCKINNIKEGEECCKECQNRPMVGYDPNSEIDQSKPETGSEWWKKFISNNPPHPRNYILDNYKLNRKINGAEFPIDEYGYKRYLIERNYAPITAFLYTKAIFTLKEVEHISFSTMMAKIYDLTNEYSPWGRKKDWGDTGDGVWRNALCRLKEFREYKEKYMGKAKFYF